MSGLLLEAALLAPLMLPTGCETAAARAVVRGFYAISDAINGRREHDAPSDAKPSSKE